MESWHVGDRLFAYWEADGYWYPATIIGIDGDDIEIRYDDGNEEKTSAEYVEDLEVSEDDVVEARSAQDNAYYEAVVTTIEGDRLQVTYEDGSTEWTSLGQLRVAEWEGWEPDDRVFAYWEPDGYFYPATVVEVTDDNVSVRYDDGEEEVTDESYLEDLAVEVGDYLENRSSEDDLYYAAEVVDIQDDKIQVKYEDESTEWTDVSTLRVQAEEEEEED